MSPPVVNFTNILLAAFEPISHRQKLQTQTTSAQKSSAKHFRMKKLIIKCWWNCHLENFFAVFAEKLSMAMKEVFREFHLDAFPVRVVDSSISILESLDPVAIVFLDPTDFLVLGSISPTFYKQLLRTQIPKAQKSASLDCLFGAFGICKRKSCA